VGSISEPTIFNVLFSGIGGFSTHPTSIITIDRESRVYTFS